MLTFVEQGQKKPRFTRCVSFLTINSCILHTGALMSYCQILSGYLREGHAPSRPQGPGVGESRHSDLREAELHKPDGI